MPETEEAQPTPGPVAQGVTTDQKRKIAKVLKGTDMVDNHNVYCDIYSKRHPVEGQEPIANADLIEDAFTAAHDLPDEYDPVEALAALPNLLSTIERMLDEIGSNDPSEPGAQRPSSGAILSMKGALQKARGGSHE